MSPHSKKSCGGKFYCVDTQTKKRESLKTGDASEAQRIVNAKNEATRVAFQDAVFDLIRNKPLIETTATDFWRCWKTGTVSTNVFLRRLQNFSEGMSWSRTVTRFDESRRSIAALQLHRVLDGNGLGGRAHHFVSRTIDA